jgi:hypothetical protein
MASVYPSAMTSQANLARSFENGATTGKASSVEIREFEPSDSDGSQSADSKTPREIEGGHAIVDTRGKGAVLAYRYPSGKVVAFEGWYGYSPSTSCMMTKMGLSPACRHEDGRHYRANTTAAEAPVTRVGGRREYIGDWLEGRSPTGIGANVSTVNK